ncbi:hypothetical protein JAAARDRAFT_37149 [Jaapia argillacea MUCL 33604]|uniref:Uncharacterized protein n=1 Tax=Jaapia argillacea MUCL 33604 TaxID=933084 RepID=A0A067PZF1_9AGAM|nr:hypothetical protein JAAARDRAFT_37149 [Jaapia argillacea MUCL 33604]
MSNILPYSLLSETQVLVAYGLDDAWGTYNHWFNHASSGLSDGTSPQGMFSPRLLGGWLDTLLSADRLSAAVFRTLLKSLIGQPPDFGTNIDFILNLSACLMQRSVWDAYMPDIDDFFKTLERFFFVRYPNWDALPASKTAVEHLAVMLSRPLNNIPSPPAVIQTLSYCVSPCRGIWCSFSRHWYFEGGYQFCDPRSRLPLRVIQPRIRTRLCCRLIDHVVG